jgi:hypothetical protein
MGNEVKKSKMVNLSGEAGQECIVLIDAIKKMIEDQQKRKIYNTEIVYLGLCALKVKLTRDKEEQHAMDIHFGQTIIE